MLKGTNSFELGLKGDWVSTCAIYWGLNSFASIVKWEVGFYGTNSSAFVLKLIVAFYVEGLKDYEAGLRVCSWRDWGSGSSFFKILNAGPLLPKSSFP